MSSASPVKKVVAGAEAEGNKESDGEDDKSMEKMQEELKGLVFKGQKDGINSSSSSEIHAMVRRINDI